MRLNKAFLATLVSSIALVGLMPTAASGEEGGPGVLDCNPFALGAEAPAAGRVSEEAAAAGVVEPNVEAAYERALATRARAGQHARATGPVRIPVYVHVIQESATVGVVPVQRIVNQIDVLNDSFDGGAVGGANAGVVFQLIDTDVTINPSWTPMEYGDPEETQMKTALREGGARALNFYILDLSTLLGWATFPDEYAGNPQMDGVIVLNESLPGGSAVPYDLGDTGTHEVGHWLGLFHTFEGGCAAPGDFVEDTPYEAEPYFGPCNPPGAPNTCPSPGLDPVENFMDYSDDACMDEFTPGQVDRLHDATAAFRNGPPSAPDRAVSTPAGQAVAIDASATDPDGDALTYANVDVPDHGTLSGSGAALTYTPAAGYSGADSFVVQATDIFGATDTSAISVTVTGGDGVDLKAKAKQKLSKLSVTGTCGSEACELSAEAKIVAKSPGGRKAGAKKTFRVKRVSAQADANGSAKLRLKLAKSKERKLQGLLKDGWKAKAKAKVTATGASGAKSNAKASITVKRG